MPHVVPAYMGRPLGNYVVFQLTWSPRWRLTLLVFQLVA